MMDVISRVLPELPEYIRVISPEEKTNTYDLIAAADLGLVYTTTVGLEIAMSGVPVIVAGETHYRNKGFTLDPEFHT
jgi:lipid A disaccharide synthetase